MKAHRLFLILMLAPAAVWIYTIVDYHLQDSSDQEFYQKHVVPYVTAVGSGKKISAPDPLHEWSRRTRRTAENFRLFLQTTVVCVSLLIGWAAFVGIRHALYQRRREAPNRPADPGAGTQLAALERSGGQLSARWTGGGWQFPHYAGDEVRVDVHKRKVTFRGFVFLAGFVGNRRTEQTDVPFSALLGSRMHVHRGRVTLQLRTTKGRVYLSDSLKPFAPLVAVLLDAIEVNRRSPEAFRAALASEPDSSTPWYVWLGIAGTGVVVFVLVGWAFS